MNGRTATLVNRYAFKHDEEPRAVKRRWKALPPRDRAWLRRELKRKTK